MPADASTSWGATCRATHALREPGPVPAADDQPDPDFSRPGIELLRERCVVAAAEGRYRFEGLIGSGATGKVYALYDHGLGRPLAAKVLHDGAQLARFLDEARITAGLEHPNVVSVHDVDVCPDGRPYFTMHRVAGRSLAEVIAASTPMVRDAAIANANAVVSIGIALVNALAYAHHSGIIHQDVKPDNVMLGRFGEILLVDWGAARRLSETAASLYGTPLYMAPEQARREHADQRSDLYCCGATLFHALLLRPAMFHQDAAEFWRRKRSGELDAPSDDERRRVPAPLLAILLKAMAARPEDRYASAEAFVGDLRAYQAGLAVSALRETLRRRIWRIVQRHPRAIGAAAAALLVISALVAALVAERLKERSSWGAPRFSDAFAGGRHDGWRTIAGEFATVPGGIASSLPSRNVLAWPERFTGDTAIEVAARVLPGAHLGDLAIGWSRHPITRPEDITFRCAIGEWDGSNSAIKVDDNYVALLTTERQERGRTYRIRLEVVGDRLTLLVDGKAVAGYVDPFPFGGGYVALFAFDPGKLIERVDMWRLRAPERLPATSSGDLLANRGMFDDAAVEYLRVAEDQAGAPLSDVARFRAGLCRLRLGEIDAARSTWAPIADPEQALMAQLELAHRSDPDGADAFLEAVARCGSSGDDALIDRAAQYWCERIERLHRLQRTADLPRYLEVHAHWLATRPLTRHQAALATLMLGRYQELIDRYPDQDLIAWEGLVALGHSEEAYARAADRRLIAMCVLGAMGRWQELRDRYCAADSPERGYGMIEEGRPEELLRIWRRDSNALIAAGRADDVLQTTTSASVRARALIAAGRFHEVRDDAQLDTTTRIELALAHRDLQRAQALAETWPRLRAWPHQLAGVLAAAAGRLDEAERLFSALDAEALRQDHFSFAHFVIAPFSAWLQGRRGALADACAHAQALGRYADQQRPWHRAAYLRGEIDSRAFLAQPHRRYAAAELTLLDAVRAEMAGDPAAACRGYSAYLEIPRHLRCDFADPTVDEFATWRSQATRGGGASAPRATPAGP